MDEQAKKDPIRNYTMVGACYDIRKVDPTDLSTNAAKFENAFELGELEDIKDQKWSRPMGLRFRAAFGGKTDKFVSEVSSAYDFKTSVLREGSLTVSDPTGLAFSATLSASFEDVQQQTRTRRKVMTRTSRRERQFRLEVAEDAELSAELRSALEQLPEQPSSSYTTFVQRLGTHYLKGALFGGRATQNISLSTEDYLSLAQEGIDFKAQATLTLDMLKSEAAARMADKREQKFTKASSLEIDQVVYVGGSYTQQFLDMWAMQVPEQPMPIEGEFAPLYELLTPKHLLEPNQRLDSALVEPLRKKQQLLKEATEEYLRKGVDDPRSSLLRYGDVVALEIAGAGLPRLLSADSGGQYARTVRREGVTDDPPPEARWMLLSFSEPDTKKEVKTGREAPDVILRNIATGMLLDAQAGSDEEFYRPGKGLAGAVESDPSKISAHWTVEVLGAADRTDLVDRDIVRLRSRWRLPRKPEPGYLLGEADCENPGQRVYGFGTAQQPGAFWALRRVAVGK